MNISNTKRWKPNIVCLAGFFYTGTQGIFQLMTTDTGSGLGLLWDFPLKSLQKRRGGLYTPCPGGIPQIPPEHLTEMSRKISKAIHKRMLYPWYFCLVSNICYLEVHVCLLGMFPQQQMQNTYSSQIKGGHLPQAPEAGTVRNCGAPGSRRRPWANEAFKHILNYF